MPTRSKVEIINRDTDTVVKKTFFDKRYHHNELKYMDMFKGYSWCPTVLDSGDDYIIYEYYDTPLEDYIRNKPTNEQINVLREVISTLYDIYSHGVAHRDVHMDNLFYKDGVKLIDFELAGEIDNSNTSFSESYDIIGKVGRKTYRCLFSEDKYSIIKGFSR